MDASHARSDAPGGSGKDPAGGCFGSSSGVYAFVIRNPSDEDKIWRTYLQCVPCARADYSTTEDTEVPGSWLQDRLFKTKPACCPRKCSISFPKVPRSL